MQIKMQCFKDLNSVCSWSIDQVRKMISQEHSENYEYRITLITRGLIHFSITATNNWIYNTMAGYGVMIWNIAHGVNNNYN